MKLILINHSFVPMVNVGLASIIAALRQEAHDVGLIDLAFTPRRHAQEKVMVELEREQPDAIGISTGFMLEDTISLIQAICSRHPDSPLLLGGVLPTFAKEALMAGCRNKQDRVVMFGGEAESGVVSFLRDYEAGRAARTGCRMDSASASPDAHPLPDYRLFDMRRYFEASPHLTGYLPVYASKGCPFSCSFCDCKDRPYMHKSPERVIEEMLTQESRHKTDGMRAVGFHDNVFGFHRDSFEEMMRLFREEGIHERLPWFCQTRPEVVTRGWAERAASSGCLTVSLGLESGDEQVRQDILNRHYTNGQFRQAAANLKVSGILPVVNLMAGVPGTSFWTDLRSAVFAHSCGAGGISVHPFYAVEGWHRFHGLPRKHVFPETTPKARMKASALKAISIPLLALRGILSHHHRYPLTILRSFAHHARSGRLTSPYLPGYLLNRTMFDLRRGAYLKSKGCGQ